MATALVPILTLLGVVVGALLSRRTGNAAWLRAVRKEQYLTLFHHVAATERAILQAYKVLAHPDDYEDWAAWTAAVNAQTSEVRALGEPLRDISEQLILFASSPVNGATLTALQVFDALKEGAEGESTGAVPPPGAPWPSPSAESIAEIAAEACTATAHTLQATSERLVHSLRIDMGVDRRSTHRLRSYTR